MATSPTVRRRRLGAGLRALRLNAGKTLEEVGEHLGCAHAKISRFENAHRTPTAGDVHRMMAFYGLSADEIEPWIQLAKDARKKGWWQTYKDLIPEWYETLIGLEAEALSVLTYENEVIPGLLQTRDYATELTKATLLTAVDDTIDRRVELRMERQKRLNDDDPPEFWAVVSEAALRRPVGGVDIHRAQLEHLIAMSELRHVTVQVLPFSAGAHPAMAGSFTILRFPNTLDQDVVYLETQVGGHFLEEAPEIETYGRLMEHCRALAVDPRQTASVVRQIAQELTCPNWMP